MFKKSHLINVNEFVCYCVLNLLFYSKILAFITTLYEIKFMYVCTYVLVLPPVCNFSVRSVLLNSSFVFVIAFIHSCLKEI